MIMKKDEQIRLKYRLESVGGDMKVVHQMIEQMQKASGEKKKSLKLVLEKEVLRLDSFIKRTAQQAGISLLK